MRFFTHNLGWKLLALVAAFAVWINIASEPELSTILSAPVQFRNYPKDLEISSAIVESIDVEARGPSGQLRGLSESRIAAIIDFAGVRAPGERTFTMTANELNLPRGITLIRTIPAQMRFKFEHRATRSIAVDVPTSGTLPPGLLLSRLVVDPPMLTIAGPESRVAAARKATSDPFDLSQVTKDSQQSLSVYIGEPEIRFVSPPRVTVKIHVEQTH